MFKIKLDKKLSSRRFERFYDRWVYYFVQKRVKRRNVLITLMVNTFTITIIKLGKFLAPNPVVVASTCVKKYNNDAVKSQ